MTTKEQTRLQILNEVLERRWSMREAKEVLGVSERHAWRLLAAYRKEGAAALAHGNRGRVPLNATPTATRQQVVTMARERYGGINYTHLSELLAEREGLMVSRSTVRRLLVGAGLPSPRHRRPPRHRMRRQRMPQEGMLLQMDGSHHAWLEERGPRLTLHLAIDDATGRAPHAIFQEQETTEGYLLLLRGVVRKWGIPLAVYTDRHAAFVSRIPTTEERPGAHQGRTQFARALRELGVTQIFALSPEGKGRVERANGTFQGRLVAELRLAGANTLTDANRVLEEFLPRFNKRFGVPAAEAGPAYRQPDDGLDVDGVLCIKERRQVARDNTVQYNGRVLQLFPDADRPSYAGARVEVQERLDGRILVSYRGKILTPQDAPPLAATLRAQAEAIATNPPVVWEDLCPLAAVRERRPRSLVVPGPLAGDTIWYEDPVRKSKHSKLVRAGMERARREGRRIGRPNVIERDGFLEQFAAVVERLGEGSLSRRRAAVELDIGYATLKRLMDARLAAVQRGGTGSRSSTKADPRQKAMRRPWWVFQAKRGIGYAPLAKRALLTESLNSKP
ncbi:MAG: ISNCY family transposase [Dehalococcoidia bacterium]|nr:ISNCY family transposase [Dehalococcoidia bacterium]